MNNKKGNILIIVLSGFLLLAIGAASYFFWQNQQLQQSQQQQIVSQPTPIITSAPSQQASPTPITQADKTSNWKTYSNRIISFSYPQDSGWKIFPSEDNSVAAMCETCLASSNIDLLQVGTVIFKSLEEFMAQDTLLTDKKRITFSGLPAVQGVQSGGPQAGGSMIQVFVVYKDKGYLIGERFKKLYDKTMIDEFPQASPDILSTLKFK